MDKLFWLTDEQMERLRPFFPKSAQRFDVEACACRLWSHKDA